MRAALRCAVQHRRKKKNKKKLAGTIVPMRQLRCYGDMARISIPASGLHVSRQEGPGPAAHPIPGHVYQRNTRVGRLDQTFSERPRCL